MIASPLLCSIGRVCLCMRHQYLIETQLDYFSSPLRSHVHTKSSDCLRPSPVVLSGNTSYQCAIVLAADSFPNPATDDPDKSNLLNLVTQSDILLII